MEITSSKKLLLNSKDCTLGPYYCLHIVCCLIKLKLIMCFSILVISVVLAWAKKNYAHLFCYGIFCHWQLLCLYISISAKCIFILINIINKIVKYQNFESKWPPMTVYYILLTVYLILCFLTRTIYCVHWCSLFISVLDLYHEFCCKI